MPPVVAAIAAIAGALAGAFSVAGVVKAIVGTALSIGLSMGASALGKKKAQQGIKQAGSRINISQSSVDSHKIAYGRVRVSGTLLLSHTQDAAGRENNLLYFYIALAAHEIDGFEELWVNEKQATLDGNGAVTNMYKSLEGVPRITIGRFNGRDNQSVTLLPPLMNSAHRMRGIAISLVRMIWDRTAFPNGVPQFSEVIRGRKVYDPRAATVAISSEGSGGVITTATNHGLAVNDSVWVVSATDAKNREARVNSVPAANKLTLRDPYSGSESNMALSLSSSDKLSKMAWSNNWALVVRDYLSNPQWGLGSRASEIDDDTVIASANISDESVSLAGGGTEKRYTANGVIDTADGPFDIIEELRTAGGPGIITFMQGQWKVIAAAYSSPVANITADWLAADIQVQTRLPRKELFNAVKGVYIDPDKQWQPTDFPAVTNALYQSQDKGERIYQDIQLPYTTSVATAQRIAKIILERGRQQIIATLPCNLRALQVGIGDTVTVTLADLGWSNKVFRVERWEMDQEDGVLLTLKEEAPSAYSWNNGEETTVDPAPDTTLPDPNSVLPPGNPLITEVLYVTADGTGVKSKAILNWAESRTFNIDRYVVDYKKVGDTEYTPAGETISTSLEIFDLQSGTYEFRVRALTLLGAESPSASTLQEFAGLNTPPADLGNFGMTAIHNQAHLSWTQSPDLDVRVGGYVRLRWSSNPDGTWSEGIDLGEALPGIATNAVVPLLAGVYMIKAVDSSGNDSIDAARIQSDIVNVLQMNAVESLAQHPTFAGSKTAMSVVSGSLQLDGLPGFIELAGEYVFDVPLDLGAIYTLRAYMAVSAEVFDTVSTFDESDGLFDSREGLFDGADIAGVKVEFYLKTTNDDPTGSDPDDVIWSDWRKFVVGDFTARAFWAKAVVTNTKASNNIAIDALSLNVDVPDREERFEDVAIDDLGSTVTYAKPFYSRPSVGLTIQGAVSGDTPVISHVTSGGKWTGATLQVLNAGVGVDRVVDIAVRGF